MHNKISRRNLFSLIASVPAVMLIVPEAKVFRIDHPMIHVLNECADKNISAWPGFMELKNSDVELSGLTQLPKKFWPNYRNYIEENFPENFKEVMSYRERYHHLLNTIQNQWKPEGYTEHFESALMV